MKIGHNAYIALYNLSHDRITSEEERKSAIDRIKLALSMGLSVEDFELLEDKKKAWQYDDVIDANKDVNKVLKAHPAVELKLFGTNDTAKSYWKSLM